MNKSIIVLSLLASLSLSACHKDMEIGDTLLPQEKIDTKSDKIYFSSGILGKSGAALLQVNETEATVSTDRSIYVYTTKPAAQDLTIELKVETSTSDLSAYNTSVNETNKLQKTLPNGIGTLKSNTVVIKAGKTQSEAPVEFDIDKTKDLQALESGRYLATIKVSSAPKDISILYGRYNMVVYKQ